MPERTPNAATWAAAVGIAARRVVAAERAVLAAERAAEADPYTWHGSPRHDELMRATTARPGERSMTTEPKPTVQQLARHERNHGTEHDYQPAWRTSRSGGGRRDRTDLPRPDLRRVRGRASGLELSDAGRPVRGCSMSIKLTLALAVALDRPEHWGDDCPAWIEAADRQCGKPREVGYLCKRHHTVATRRLAKQAEKDAARDERHRAEQERMRPEREARLATVEAEIARLDPPPPTTDPAAWGGVGHAGESRYRSRYTPDRIHRLAELTAEADRLRRLVGPREDH